MIRTTASAESEAYHRTWGKPNPPNVSIVADYAPGDEDLVLGLIDRLRESVITQINAARPAAASTPQEGTTP